MRNEFHWNPHSVPSKIHCCKSHFLNFRIITVHERRKKIAPESPLNEFINRVMNETCLIKSQLNYKLSWLFVVFGLAWRTIVQCENWLHGSIFGFKSFWFEKQSKSLRNKIRFFESKFESFVINCSIFVGDTAIFFVIDVNQTF